MNPTPAKSAGGLLRQIGLGLNVTAFMLGVIALAVVLNFFAQRENLRLRIDSTKTRAYSLSEQTQILLADLQGEWTIAIVMVEANVDRAVRRQVNEVLRRFTQASPRITAVRIDPTDPATLDDYEALLANLRVIYKDRIEAYETALKQGEQAIGSFDLFLQQLAGRLDTLARDVQRDDPIRAELDQLLGIVSLRQQQGGQVRLELDKAMREDDTRPVRDYETARSLLAAALSGWADELYGIARMFDRWRADPKLNPAVRAFTGWAKGELDQQAQALAVVADPLKRLPTMELGTIGRQIERGEAAVVVGPGGAALIPSGQIFPQVGATGGANVTFDQRFRGELVIASAIRSLRVEHMPMVVFVHAQEDSLFGRRETSIDLAGAVGMLDVSRYQVQEWIVMQGDRPTPRRGQAVVWVVIPPPVLERRSLAPTREEYALIDAVKRLIADGEAVMLNFTPSFLHKFGQVDPWQSITPVLGLDVDTSRVVIEKLRDEQGADVIQRVAQMTDFAHGHPIAAAVHGLQTSFDLPVVVRPAELIPTGVRHTDLALIKPAPHRWLETDWAVNPASINQPIDRSAFDEPLPIAVAVERTHPIDGGLQRCIVIGSGGWLMSYLADRVVDAGGERVMLVNPGNYELLLASIAWLAGQDEMIAPSAVSQQVSRLDGITPAVRTRWRWIAVVVMPGGCLMLGAVVWFIRRR